MEACSNHQGKSSSFQPSLDIFTALTNYTEWGLFQNILLLFYRIDVLIFQKY